jgi:hypothetical protein
MTTGGWWTTDDKVRHRHADGTSGAAGGREAGPMHPAGNLLTVCHDCQSNNQTVAPTERPLPNGRLA